MSLVRFQARNHPQQTTRPDVDDRATDPVFFDMLNDRFRFTVDVCATEQNAKLPRFYTPGDNGLKKPWAGERVWCNPPYSDIEPWVIKAWHEWNLGVDLVVMLLPANRTEQGWWHRRVERARDRSGPLRVEFLPGRLRFIRPGAQFVGPNERPPFGCCLLIWGDES